MTNAEKELLADAIETAIEAEKKRILWRRIAIVCGLVAVAFMFL